MNSTKCRGWVGITMDKYWTPMGQLLDNYWITIIDDSIEETLFFMKSQKNAWWTNLVDPASSLQGSEMTLFVPLVSPPAYRGKKQLLLLLLLLPAGERSAGRLLFFYVFFIAIADNVFVCIDFKNATLIFSTCFNTTWAIAWHFTMW